MAIVFMESFDMLPTFNSTTVNGWNVTDNNASISSSGPRTGVRNLETRQHVVYKTIAGATWPEIIYSAGVKMNIIGAGTMLQFRESVANVTHLQLRMDSFGKLQVYNGAGSVLLGTGTTVMAAAAWYWLEIWVKVHDTLGTVELRLGGDTEIGPLGPIDTRNGGTGFIDQLYYSAPFFNCGHQVDDIVIIDPTTGPAPTTWIGDSRVECIAPNGNGNSSQWLGNDGNSTDNYLLVDEPQHDSDTTYVESPTIGNKDTYAYPDISLVSGVIHAVQTSVVARKSSAGSRKIVQVSRLAGGTEADSAEYNLTDSYTYAYGGIQHTKPGGGAWALADVNGAEFGVKVSS